MQEEKNKAWWKDRAFIYLLAVGLIIAVVGFLLPRFFPPKSSKPKIPVAPIHYNSEGSPLLEVIRRVEAETDYDIIAPRQVEEFKVVGDFQGDHWLMILQRIVNAYDKKLKIEIDKKNGRIIITARP